ncbi:MAG: hypothetical protein HYR96_15765 [Deltaproteobacteria bacterium]|nr:hypothetical protein [Deltaproteobacteria bacterium]MBI3296511.1 hypothetical protein [Deltaproteobacteria bacterium]
MWKAVFSKVFAEKLRRFPSPRRNDIRKAIDRVLVDPDLQGYRRMYLSPYRQEHPSDKTLTLFFVVPAKPSNRVFFIWVNDDQHPHDTHKNHGDDPCLKEFVRLRDSKGLEAYSEDFHEGKFTVVPRPNAPKYMKFEKYGALVHTNILHDGATHYALTLSSLNSPSDLFDHYQRFIEKIREHFLGQKEPFEFRVYSGDLAFQNLLQQNINPGDWKQTSSGGETIFSI